MSHYLDLETCMTDEKALIKTLSRMGFDESIVEVNDNPVQMQNWKGIPTSQRANVIVRRKYLGSLVNDMGFEKTADGTYKAHIDESNKYGEAWRKKLATYYNVEKAKMAYDKRKIKYTESVDEQSRPVLKAKLYT